LDLFFEAGDTDFRVLRAATLAKHHGGASPSHRTPSYYGSQDLWVKKWFDTWLQIWNGLKTIPNLKVCEWAGCSIKWTLRPKGMKQLIGNCGALSKASEHTGKTCEGRRD